MQSRRHVSTLTLMTLPEYSITPWRLPIIQSSFQRCALFVACFVLTSFWPSGTKNFWRTPHGCARFRNESLQDDGDSPKTLQVRSCFSRAQQANMSVVNCSSSMECVPLYPKNWCTNANFASSGLDGPVIDTSLIGVPTSKCGVSTFFLWVTR